MDPTPLYEAQKQSGAIFSDVAGWVVASSFGNPMGEKKVVQDTVGIADRSHLGRIFARGSDTLDLLNRLSTNLVDPLPVGKGKSTVITTGKGRILDWITMLHHNDDVLLITSPERREAVAEWIDMYTFEENTTLEDVTTSTAMVSLLGPSAESVLETMLGTAVAQLSRLDCMVADWRGHQLIIARTNPSGQRGFDIIGPSDAGEALWDAAFELGASPVGQEALEALRISARLPKWGNELTEEHNPLEAGLEGEVSWTKGCYTGQEVVARLFNYQRIQRHLVALEVPAALSIEPNMPLLADGETAGYITSVSTLTGDSGVPALASLRTAYVELDRVLTIGNVDGVNARVIWVPEFLNEGATS
jgi:folate-binding protein YgfZ